MRHRDRFSTRIRDRDRGGDRGRIRARRPQPMPKQPPTSRTLRPNGVPGPALCRRPEQVRITLHTMPYLAPSAKTLFSLCSGSVAGRRRAIGVVAALQSTHKRPRRWCDAGQLGRQCVTTAQKAGAERTRAHPSRPRHFPSCHSEHRHAARRRLLLERTGVRAARHNGSAESRSTPKYRQASQD